MILDVFHFSLRVYIAGYGEMNTGQLSIKIQPMDWNIDIALSSVFYNVHYLEMFIHITYQSNIILYLCTYLLILNTEF